MCGLAFDYCTRRVASFLHTRLAPHHQIDCFVCLSMDRVHVRGLRVREVCSWHRNVGYVPSSDSLCIARRLLKSLSIKQGIKYDSPESAYGIRAFIEFHQLNVDEILDPLPSFSRSTPDPHRALGDILHAFRNLQPIFLPVRACIISTLRLS